MSDHMKNDHLKNDHMKSHYGPEEEGFEREDIGARTIFRFLAGVGIFLIVTYFIVIGVYGYLDRYQSAHEPLQNPLAPPSSADTRIVSDADVKEFPKPRLEKNERLEINSFRMKEEETLNSYGWVDEKAGVVHIPIERAMELVEQRGLPTLPQGAAAPVVAARDVNYDKKKDSKAKATGR
jgi:hypothetical protein